MKKILFGLTLASSLVLVACGSDDSATDGGADGGETYRIEDLNHSGTGWKEALEITVADGEITDANWESVDEDGNKKIEDDEYHDAMETAVGVGPQEFIPSLEDSLMDVQDPSEVEAVSGATSTSDKFKDYAQQLVDAAEAGNTETIQVDNQD